ncbi:MAG: hypothetical protein ACFBSG_18450 [Leptolyngbyaceae cyanobacterium]
MTHSTTPSKTIWLYGCRFLGGAALGLLMVSIPFWFMSVVMTPPLWFTAASVVLLCGLMSVRWGAALVESLAQAIAHSGL